MRKTNVKSLRQKCSLCVALEELAREAALEFQEYENSWEIDSPSHRELVRIISGVLNKAVRKERVQQVCLALLKKLSKDGLIVDHSDEKELIKELLSEYGGSSLAVGVSSPSPSVSEPKESEEEKQ